MLLEMLYYVGDNRQSELQAGDISCDPENFISQQAQMLFKRLVGFFLLCSSLTRLSPLCGSSQAIALAISTLEATGG